MSPDHRALGGARTQSNDGPDAHAYLWVGRILHVDTETMVCSVRLESGEGERHDVPLPASAGGGPRSWSGGIPEPGTKVLLAWKKYSHRDYTPYIVQYVTSGIFPAREYEPFSTIDPEEAASALEQFPDMANDPKISFAVTRLKARKGYSGDYIASSSGGADFILDRDVLLTNRAGNEIRLRDSDQTVIVQSLNEFTSNAAGYYRRGLIKRNAFNLLPDLFNESDTIFGFEDDGVGGFKVPATVPTSSPAFEKLLQFGLVKEDGSKNFPDDPDDPFYPYVVLPDGQRTSYVVAGEHEFGFADTNFGYVEDRKELRHISDGTMTVTEEGDGFQIDYPAPVFIEDVWGTIVGNDPYTEAGRPLYKRILTMRVFESADQQAPSTGPKFEAVDTITDPAGEPDTIALARLLRIHSPTNGNQFAFGITKEGRVFAHVPKSKTGKVPDDVGKSVDLNIEGLLKMIIGSDQNSGASVDAKLQGGLLLDIGRLPDGRSARIRLGGSMKLEYAGIDTIGVAREVVVSGSDSRVVASSVMDQIGGSYVRVVGGTESVEATSVSHNAGPGGYKLKSAGDYGETVLGKTLRTYALPRLSTFALADTKVLLAGIDSSTVLAGAMTRTVATGVGIADTVGVGNMTSTVGTGNIALTVGAGNIAATIGAGNLALTTGAGSASLVSSLTVSVLAGVVAQMAAPINKIGLVPVGNAVAGIPGPPAPHLDYITGLPLRGLGTIFLGILWNPKFVRNAAKRNRIRNTHPKNVDDSGLVLIVNRVS